MLTTPERATGRKKLPRGFRKQRQPFLDFLYWQTHLVYMIIPKLKILQRLLVNMDTHTSPSQEGGSKGAAGRAAGNRSPLRRSGVAARGHVPRSRGSEPGTGGVYTSSRRSSMRAIEERAQPCAPASARCPYPPSAGAVPRASGNYNRRSLLSPRSDAASSTSPPTSAGLSSRKARTITSAPGQDAR